MGGRFPPGATVALISPSGWGNLGDAAIIESLIHGLRGRVPRVRIIAFTLNAEETARQHGVEAFTLLGYSPKLYTMQDTWLPAAGEEAGRTRGAVRSLRDGLRRLPLRGRARLFAAIPLLAARETRHLSWSRNRLEGVFAVVVAGGGQLDDFFGGPLGQPYALLRWGLLARSVGARFIVASVGTGTLSLLSRVLVRRALALADYRSFRDDRSRELVGAPRLTHGDPTVPDLAYALPVHRSPQPSRAQLTIGLSPMAFSDPGHWPRADAERYRRHVHSFRALAAELLCRGHQVVLFTTDDETKAIEDTLESVELSAEARGRLSVAATPSLDSLFRLLANVDLVVAARLHGALLAHVAGRPVLAVSHDRKVRALMEDMDQARYCLDIESFDPGDGLALIDEIAAGRASLETAIGCAVELRRARVEAQFDALFGPPAVSSSKVGARQA